MTQPVVSGQLITADFANGILTRLTNLEAAVAALKNASAVSAGPTITSIYGLTTPIREGDAINITGTNFGFSTGSQSLSFNGISVASFVSGSSDTLLLVRVPALGASASGTLVAVVEGNGNGFDTQQITVYPAFTPVANQDIQIIWNSVSPNPILPGQPMVVGFTLISKAPQTATYTISAAVTPVNPTATSPAWPSTYQVLDSSNNVTTSNQFTLNPNAQTNFSVQINVPPGSDNSQFQLAVNAGTGSGGTAATNSTTVPLSVSTATTLPDSTIGLAFGTFTALNTLGVPDQTAGKFDSSTGTIQIKVGCTASLTMNATFQKAGTYTCAIAAAPGSGSSANWFTNPVPAQEIVNSTAFTNQSTVPRNPVANFTPSAGAGSATFNYTITNQAGPTTGRSLPINVTVTT
ncbi:MAG TPA: IPT/TIG domain-containing protein [Polyangiaceae bacterium]|jgi:hypothetical protein